MREIKFRAWNTVGNVYLRDLCYVGDGWYEVDNLIFEQYTGLKDKNGKEIYEGDVVDLGYAIKIMQFYSNLGYDGKYMASGFYFDSQLDYHGRELYDWEILGNIHENPELLER